MKAPEGPLQELKVLQQAGASGLGFSRGQGLRFRV